MLGTHVRTCYRIEALSTHHTVLKEGSHGPATKHCHFRRHHQMRSHSICCHNATPAAMLHPHQPPPFPKDASLMNGFAATATTSIASSLPSPLKPPVWDLFCPSLCYGATETRLCWWTCLFPVFFSGTTRHTCWLPLLQHLTGSASCSPAAGRRPQVSLQCGSCIPPHDHAMSLPEPN
jgi:hypothetical protein